MTKTSILGCGNGGMALAADLKLKGLEVALWADGKHATKLDSVKQNNNEVVLHEGNQTQTAQLDLVTKELSAVVQFGEIIYFCTPMDIHVDLFQQIATLLKKVLIALAKLYHLELPNIQSMVQIFSTVMGVNYLENGRNLSGLTLGIIESLSKPAHILPSISMFAKTHKNSGFFETKDDEQGNTPLRSKL